MVATRILRIAVLRFHLRPCFRCCFPQRWKRFSLVEKPSEMALHNHTDELFSLCLRSHASVSSLEPRFTGYVVYIVIEHFRRAVAPSLEIFPEIYA